MRDPRPQAPAVHPGGASETAQPRPLVVLYLYLTEQGETHPPHPSVRTSSPERYLECALTQTASLRLQDARCDIALATNLGHVYAPGRRAARLLSAIESFGVEIVPTEFRPRRGTDSRTYGSSRFVRDAVLSAAEGQPFERRLWVPDLDCVWIDPDRVFAAAPGPGEVGCIFIPYPPGWEVGPSGELAGSRQGIAELAGEMGAGGGVPDWVGGDLLAGTAGVLGELVAACEALDSELNDSGRGVSSEQQVLTLLGALGRVRFRDLSQAVRRIHTGARHRSVPPEDATLLGLWHLTSEKGLSLRRAAREIARGDTGSLLRDLRDPPRAARRFNVAGTGRGRAIRDDSWIAAQRLAALLRSRTSAPWQR
jgi:hypothetical protein